MMVTGKEILDQFKNKLANDDSVLGSFMKTCDPAFVECAGFSGFDFAILDMEHGPVSIETLQNLIRAAIISEIVPIVRVPSISEESIGKPLDIGALGIQVPQVNSAAQAKNAIEFSKFHPNGGRGVCRFVRAAKYSTLDRFDYFKSSNEIILILQLEGMEGLANLDEILEIEGFA